MKLHSQRYNFLAVLPAIIILHFPNKSNLAVLDPDNITIPMIEEQLDFIGSLIVKKPEKYECLLPIYERLEKEIDARRARNDRFASIKARINRIKSSNKKQTHISV